MIDFNDSNTFPAELKEWGIEFENRLRQKINTNGVREWWQIEHQLQDLHIEDTELVRNYIDNNMDKEVVLCHCTRIIDETEYWKHGIVTGGGKNSVAEKRLTLLLHDIGLDEKQIAEIFSHIYYYWNRDKSSRIDSVHFFIDQDQVYRDDQLNHFAINVGGEILRWSLEAINRELYKKEPYKRLWILGSPSVIKFKMKLQDIHELYRHSLMAEIVKYYIVTEVYGYNYEFDFAGMTIGAVVPENILSITKIRNYIQMQEKYPDYEGFYEEIKNSNKQLIFGNLDKESW